MHAPTMIAKTREPSHLPPSARTGDPAARDVVRHFATRRILASVTPFDVAYTRLALGLFNTPGEVERCPRAVAELLSFGPASRR